MWLYGQIQKKATWRILEPFDFWNSKFWQIKKKIFIWGEKGLTSSSFYDRMASESERKRFPGKDSDEDRSDQANRENSSGTPEKSFA
jgi:hypothetical protein